MRPPAPPPPARPRRIASGLLPGLVAASLIAGCASQRAATPWAGVSGPGSEYSDEQEYVFPLIDDPLEPVNRVVWTANNSFALLLVAPVARMWRMAMPQQVRTRLVMAGRNLLFPVRVVNNLLQAKWGGAGDETARFAINTTVGAAGLFDPARSWGYLPAEEDSGQTLKEWGWHDSNYLMLPLQGPSTLRDTLGFAADTALDPLSYFFPASLVRTFVERSENIEAYRRFVQTYYDAYLPARRLYVVNREVLAADFQYARRKGAETQTLRAVFLGPKDPEFAYRGRTRSVEIPATGRKLYYEAWMQREPAPVVFIIPGLGSHRRSEHALALAEVAYDAGFSAVTVSNAMSFDFMETASTAWVPGFAAADGREVHAALEAVHQSLARRYRERMTGRVLLGMSLGAFHTMLIAAETAGGEGFGFDRYVAINPPVRILHAMEQLDGFYNVPLKYPAEERDARVLSTLKKITAAGAAGTLTPDEPMALSEAEAEFTIGLYFRLALHDTIWSSQSRHDMGKIASRLSYLRRTPASREILQISYMEYFYGFVLPYYRDVRREIASAAELIEQSSLERLRDRLRLADSLRVFTNANDFLLAKRDVRWLVETLGAERIRLYRHGGHMGNLYDPKVQAEVVDSISDLLER